MPGIIENYLHKIGSNSTVDDVHISTLAATGFNIPYRQCAYAHYQRQIRTVPDSKAAVLGILFISQPSLYVKNLNRSNSKIFSSKYSL